MSNIYWNNDTLDTIDIDYSRIISSSLGNLKRLGLISIEYGAHITVQDAYAPLQKLPLYEEFINEYKTFNNSSDAINNPELQLAYHEIVKGIVELTDFGKKFCEACIC